MGEKIHRDAQWRGGVAHSVLVAAAVDDVLAAAGRNTLAPSSPVSVSPKRAADQVLDAAENVSRRHRRLAQTPVARLTVTPPGGAGIGGEVGALAAHQTVSAPCAAFERVVARAAEQHVVAGTAAQIVVAVGGVRARRQPEDLSAVECRRHRDCRSRPRRTKPDC